MELYLAKPSLEYKKQIMDFRQEFISNQEIAYGTQHLYNYTSLEEWLEQIRLNEKAETVESGRPPSYEFMAIRKEDEKIVGMINIRYNLTDEMLMFLGHIGYCVVNQNVGRDMPQKCFV